VPGRRPARIHIWDGVALTSDSGLSTRLLHGWARNVQPV